MTPLQVVAATAVMGLGACVQGAVGFGSNLIAAPLLVLIDERFIPGPVNVASFVLNLVILARGSTGHADPRIRWAIGGLLPGTLVAGALLASLPQHQLSVAFAITVVLAVLASLSGWSIARTAPNLVGAGAVSGFMGTVSGIGGPPVALAYQHEPASTLRATLPRFFLASGVVTLITLVAVGRLGYEEMRLSAALIPGLVIGVLASGRVAAHLDRRTARPAVLALSAVAAAAVLARELL